MPSYSIVHDFASPQELIAQLQQAWNKGVISLRFVQLKVDTWHLTDKEVLPPFQWISKVKFEQTFRKNCQLLQCFIDIYENIFNDVSNNIDFVMYMLLIYSKILVKLYIA
jgi:hypothetical protein